MEGNPRKRNCPSHPLKRVKELLGSGAYRIKGNAQRTAKDDLGFEEEDIRNCLLSLGSAHFAGTNEHQWLPHVMVDHYRLSFRGQKVYLHLYIDSQGDLVVVNSFKAA